MNKKRFLKERQAYALLLGYLNVQLIEQQLAKNLEGQAKTKKDMEKLVNEYCKVVLAYRPENE